MPDNNSPFSVVDESGLPTQADIENDIDSLIPGGDDAPGTDPGITPEPEVPEPNADPANSTPGRDGKGRFTKGSPALDPNPAGATVTEAPKRPKATTIRNDNLDPAFGRRPDSAQTPKGKSPGAAAIEDPAAEEAKKKAAEAVKPDPNAKPPPEERPKVEDPKADKIELPPGTSPKAREQFLKMEKARDEAVTKAATLETQLKAINEEVTKLKGSTGKLPDDVERELTELRDLRAAYYVTKDPEFKKTYDDKINTYNDEAFSLMEQNGVPKDQIEIIKAKGGIFGLKLQEPDAKGNMLTVPLLDSKWFKDMMDHLPFDQKATLDAVLKNSLLLQRGRQAALDNMPKTQEEFEKRRFESWKTDHDTKRKVHDDTVAEMQKTAEWANPKELTGKETPEEKAKIEAHNAYAAEVQKTYEHIDKNLDKDPKVRAETIGACLLAFWQADQLEALTKQTDADKTEIERLTVELGKYKQAGSTGRTVLASSKTAAPAANPNMSAEEAFDNHFGT